MMGTCHDWASMSVTVILHAKMSSQQGRQLHAHGMPQIPCPTYRKIRQLRKLSFFLCILNTIHADIVLEVLDIFS